MSLKTFIYQCRERKIFKGFSIYAISSWIIIQVAATTFPYLGIPTQAVTFIIILVLIGLPFSLIFSWYYNVVTDELDDEKEIPVISDRVASKIFKGIILGVFAIVITVIIMLIKRNFKTEIQRSSSNRIAILDFKNSTGDKQFDLLGKIVADWIEFGIIENNMGTVVSSEVISNYEEVAKASALADPSDNVLNQLSVEKTISGGIYKDGDVLIAKGTVYRWPDRESSYAFESTEIDPENPTEGINDIKNKVLGYLLSAEQRAIVLQDDPPNYEVFGLVIKAKELMNELDPMALQLLDQVVELDSSYFEAKVLRVSYYYNEGEYAIADSLRLGIIPTTRSNTRQVNLLNFYNALLSGKNKAIYDTWAKEYKFAPFELPTNQNMMVLALQYVNKPSEVLEIYEEIDMEDLDFAVCSTCVFRKYTMANAYLDLKKYRKAVDLLEPHMAAGVDQILIKTLIAAYVRSGKMGKLRSLFSDLPNLLINEDLSGIYLKAIKELLLQNRQSEAAEFIELLKNNVEVAEGSYTQARMYMLEQSYTKSESILKALHKLGKLGFRGKSNLAISYYANGRESESDEVVREMLSEEGKYDFGAVRYNLALVEAFKGNEEKVMKYLMESVSNGYIYGPEVFYNDLAFKKYRDRASFQKIMTYWH